MLKAILLPVCLAAFSLHLAANPVYALLDRIDPGASARFRLELEPAGKDFFELGQDGDQVLVRGNNYISLATGVNWYLKYHAHIHLSWNCMKADLPDVLPAVEERERHETGLVWRYDFNYCTHSYSMVFWDWERWEREIDWMALHGVNMPLVLTGMECVWRNVLEKLGYGRADVDRFIAGPAFQAWWYMNNLEGWGGPLPDSWYDRQQALACRILRRMRSFGIEPVFPGYAGMLPSDAGEKLGLDVADPGKWCGFQRPAFLQPSDPFFPRMAALYYGEMEKLYGKARFYSMDPFHEGGDVRGVNLAAAGQAIMGGMKASSPGAVWVVQAWQANPRPAMIKGLQAGDMLVLDLSSENRPMWGDPDSPWCRQEGYLHHDWIFCMLLNYGGNVGMYGRMDRMLDGFYAARKHPNGQTLRGTGMTMEGIGNNPVMYELLMELPWREERFQKEEWLEGYVRARYGREDPKLVEAWKIMAATVYNCPEIREGTTESVFCARPAERVNSASTWGSSELYYRPEELRKAAALMLEVAEDYRGNDNFGYDLVDLVRQTLADCGNRLLGRIAAGYAARDKAAFRRDADRFLELILQQDELLSSRKEFMLGTWLEQAKAAGSTGAEKELYEWNARTQITVWGDRNAADCGGLHDYAHKEWAGLLKDFYYPRWKVWFDELERRMEGKTPEMPDWFTMEERWTRLRNVYPAEASADEVDVAARAFLRVSGEVTEQARKS